MALYVRVMDMCLPSVIPLCESIRTCPRFLGQCFLRNYLTYVFFIIFKRMDAFEIEMRDRRPHWYLDYFPPRPLLFVVFAAF